MSYHKPEAVVLTGAIVAIQGCCKGRQTHLDMLIIPFTTKDATLAAYEADE
jgi:hypothetical protein